MWTLYTKDPEHWVPVQTVASFKRMRDFASQGVEWVAKALRLSDELEVDETGTKVRRRTEVQEPKGQFERSIYAVRLALLCLMCDVPLTCCNRKVSPMKTQVSS
jgi:lupus La protein